MPGRIPCCIPGCRRTFKREPDDAEEVRVICGRHWRMADTRLRNRHKQLLRRYRKLDRMWARRHLAIERSGKYVKLCATMHRATMQCHTAWERVREDVTIKAALRAEDAPRRKPTP